MQTKAALHEHLILIKGESWAGSMHAPTESTMVPIHCSPARKETSFNTRIEQPKPSMGILIEFTFKCVSSQCWQPNPLNNSLVNLVDVLDL